RCRRAGGRCKRSPAAEAGRWGGAPRGGKRARGRGGGGARARAGPRPGGPARGKGLGGGTGSRRGAPGGPRAPGKERAGPRSRGAAHPPRRAYGDNPAEPLAGKLRKGSAGSNTVADHLEVLGAAVAALPPAYRRRLMVTCDGAGASHGLIERLDALAARPGHQLIYSVGWELGERERTPLNMVPAEAWASARAHRGEVRGRGAGQACADRGCAPRKCWSEDACVTELTGLRRQGPGGAQLEGWPASMRVFARRERPHPGAQLSLFEADDGWRYSLWVTNLPASLRGWRADLAYIDAAHRVHARVEDCVRTGKDTGIGKLPS